MNNLTEMSATGIRELISRKEVSCVEVARAHLDAAQELNPKLNALIYIRVEEMLGEAAELDSRISRGGDVPALAGLPVVVKDNICTRGTPTTCASKILGNYIPPYDATAIARLKGAGALILGKSNMDEFAMGSSNENSSFGPARNPWDPTRVPGGSSGGSACAVAARIAPLALGSDTGGSVKQPAALCGAVGLRPTYGRVSRYGLVAFASSLDQIGPLTRTVSDNILLFSAISGSDPKDSTCTDLPPFSSDPVEADVRGLRVGIPAEQFGAGLDPEVEKAVRGCASRLAEGGAEIVEIAMPHTRHAIAAYYVIANAEASSNLARFDGVRYGLRVGGSGLSAQYERTRSEGFGAEVKRRILTGTFVLSSGYYDSYYLKALGAKALIRADFEEAFARVDAILGPTTPTPAFPLGSKTANPIEMYLSDIYTIPPNLCGYPSISFPCGFSGDGLPMGAQLVARRFDEKTLYSVAAFCEGSYKFTSRPTIGAPPESGVASC